MRVESGTDISALLTRPHVLLAEDDPTLRALLARSLRDGGFHVTEACDGIELVEHVCAASLTDPFRPTAIVTDVRMPRLGGLAALRVLAPLVRVPMVVMSAAATRDVVEEAAAFGAVVIEKPDGLGALVDTLSGLFLRAPQLAAADG